jgi:FMN phosphatase YigB (HAD superfamily)
MNTILFDLDGTLLPMDINVFMKIYFDEMGTFFSDLIQPKDLINNIWASTETMIKNIENKTNEDVFMEDFGGRITGDLEIFKQRFNEFYDTAFLNVKKSIFEAPYIKESVGLLKEKGYTLVVATNPLFPLKAIKHRIKWAGFEPEDFSYITSYEKNHYCKPQIKFYEEILKDIGKTPEECFMIGNDVQEDLIAGKLGIKTFLINDYLLHRTKDEIVSDYQGSYEDFYNFSNNLPTIK